MINCERRESGKSKAGYLADGASCARQRRRWYFLTPMTLNQKPVQVPANDSLQSTGVASHMRSLTASDKPIAARARHAPVNARYTATHTYVLLDHSPDAADGPSNLFQHRLDIRPDTVAPCHTFESGCMHVVGMQHATCNMRHAHAHCIRMQYTACVPHCSKN